MKESIICRSCPTKACSGCLVPSTQPTLITTGLSELDRAALNRRLIEHNFASAYWRVRARGFESVSALPTATLPQQLRDKMSNPRDYNTGILLSKF